MTTIYKCIKGFTDRGDDRARIGQEFVIRKRDSTGDTILDRKSGRGSHIVIPVEKFGTYFQKVKPVAKKELGTPKKELVDDRLPGGSYVEILIYSPGSANQIKGEIVETAGHVRKESYRLGEDGWFVHKGHVKPAKFPIGAKVKVIVDTLNGADMKKGQIGVIEDIYRDILDYTSYEISDGKGNTWAIRQQFLEVVEEKKPDYYKFTRGFNNTLLISGLPLRVGMGAVAKEDQFECLFVVGSAYTPILEEKNGKTLIKLIKTQNLPF